MKKFMKNAFNALSSSRMRGSRSVSVLIVGIAVTLLAACGGGGGGGSSVVTPPTPTMFSSTKTMPCLIDPEKNSVSATANGATQAEADANAGSQALAKAKELCAAVTGSISVADGVSVDALYANGYSTTTPGPMQVANVADVKLVIGSTEVGATVPLTLSNFTPTSFLNKLTAKPAPGTLTYVANLIDGLGRPFKIVKTFTVVPNATACTAPAMQNSMGVCMSPPVAGSTWNTAMKAWAYPVNMLVVGFNTLPAECVTIGDACWTVKIADGTIKLVSTNAVMTGYNTRPIVFAVYKTFDGFYNQMPLYADTAADTPFASKLVWNSGGKQTATDVKGSDNGIKITYPDFGCYDRVHTGGGSWGNVKRDSCPI